MSEPEQIHSHLKRTSRAATAAALLAVLACASMALVVGTVLTHPSPLAFAQRLYGAATVIVPDTSPPADGRATLAARQSQDVAAVGRHVIAGYRDASEIKALIALGAVGGVYITTHNVGNKTAKAVAAEIAEFQALAIKNGHPPLVIATDQEGGLVSRLSPPLPRPPRLARVIEGAANEDKRDAMVRAAAKTTAINLAKLGITVNFAPVVDLDFGIRNPKDQHSRIGERAISKDAATTALVAHAYCDELHKKRILCTLKHFPGLGRVHADTHVAAASIRNAIAELDERDWFPFRDVLRTGHAAVMVGHVNLAAIDDRPASTSRAVIHGILREKWGFDGLIITDDMTMAAATGKDGDIGAAAVAALAAGADFVLVAVNTEKVYAVLASLMRATDDGTLSVADLTASAQRITRATAHITAHITAQKGATAAEQTTSATNPAEPTPPVQAP